MGLWREAACVCRPCGHTAGSGRAQAGVKRQRRRKDSFGGWWWGAAGVKVAPGSSYFSWRGPAEVRRVTERELVSLCVLRAACSLIGWPESVLSPWLFPVRSGARGAGGRQADDYGPWPPIHAGHSPQVILIHKLTTIRIHLD